MAYVPYLEAASPASARPRVWLEAAKTAKDLDVLLTTIDFSSEEPSVIEERPVQRNNELSDRAQKLDSQLTELLRPFQADALRSIASRSQSNRPDPGLARDIEAILTTPFPAADDRAKLWSTSLALEARLGEIPVRDSGAAAGSGPSRDRMQIVRELAGRRIERFSALMALAGVKSTTVGETAAAKLASMVDARASSAGAEDPGPRRAPSSDSGADWPNSRGLPTRRSSKPGNSWNGRTAMTDPVGSRAFTLDLNPNPIRQARELDLNASRAWLADHYRLESRDLRKLVDLDGFYANAELESRRKIKRAPNPRLSLACSDSSAASLSLSAKNNKRDVTISILLTKHGCRGKPAGFADGHETGGRATAYTRGFAGPAGPCP